ncbi:MAG TPA: ABC transporter ATP-binding protein [Anaerolineales bacterium]|nr:ABC transporter ATP-binding protein [Anaerolineales bacterium]
MSIVAITVEHLSKQYRIGQIQGYKSLRESLASAAGAPFRKLRSWASRGAAGLNQEDTHFWALRDVSFEVSAGELVGIVGRNGAGKSTLLKILSRITAPTSGRARIQGRVGSLLEVGTGFHPELTGRENIYLNGAILGMKRTEIERKFDAIVEFAEVSQFVDTAVKHYSSGMYLRLAFAVAAHLESEILLVDEVLAVGDSAFQKKCLGKMGDVASEGRTVVFISHNMALVQSLCKKGIVLQDGVVDYQGDISTAVRHYLSRMEEVSSKPLDDRKDRSGRGKVRLTEISVQGPSCGSLRTGEPATITLKVNNTCAHLWCTFTIYDHFGMPVTNFDSRRAGPYDDEQQQREVFVCHIEQLPLLAGKYRIAVLVSGEGDTQDYLTSACWFDVDEGLMDGKPFGSNTGYGSIGVSHRWLAPVSQT